MQDWNNTRKKISCRWDQWDVVCRFHCRITAVSLHLALLSALWIQGGLSRSITVPGLMCLIPLYCTGFWSSILQSAQKMKVLISLSSLRVGLSGQAGLCFRPTSHLKLEMRVNSIGSVCASFCFDQKPSDTFLLACPGLWQGIGTEIVPCDTKN